MWGGLLINIPSGWNLCDGTLGTPDLRSMFIKGAAAGIDPGATGGASTHTHAFTGSSANTSLVSAGTPAGTNSTSTVTPTGTVAWPAGVPTFAGSALGTHTHTFTASSNAASPKLMTVNTSSGNAASGTTGATSAGTPAGTVAWPAGVPTFSGGSNTVGAQTFTGSALGTHQHALTATGTNANASSEPAYYSLAFIQKA